MKTTKTMHLKKWKRSDKNLIFHFNEIDQIFNRIPYVLPQLSEIEMKAQYG